MGWQIIPEKDGKTYAIFTTITDSFLYRNLSKKLAIIACKQEAAYRASKEAREIIKKIESGKKPYYQFTLTIDKAIELSKHE